MDIPDWLLWIVVGLTVLQVFALVPVIRRVRGADPSARPGAFLDLLDRVGSLLFFCGLVLSLARAGSWFWFALFGLGLSIAAHAVKGVHWLRARRRPMV
ncbi:hypothetical protein LUX01_07465 [Streptomyces sudanensis]|uniref:hypothetical protein n=1 Tax=Streptomyces sudanensis TaxID=436397 RepID=UPI0020CCF44B|nr:hypothetical protein [Streptomyces sudanensis]MCP9986557.1 hypothetical protein [Streptomyces sudanensis]